MTPIQPNTQKVYTAPTNYIESFVLGNHRYYLTTDHALKSDYGRYGMCPPLGRGFYLKISKKEFKEAQKLFIQKKTNFLNALNSGYLKTGGVQTTFAF